MSAKHALLSLPKIPVQATKLAAHLARLGVLRISFMFRVPVPLGGSGTWAVSQDLIMGFGWS